MKLSKKAQQGLDDTVLKVLAVLANGQDPEAALEAAGIKGWQDTLTFLAYLQEAQPDLYKRLTD